MEVAVAVVDWGWPFDGLARSDGMPFFVGDVPINKAWAAAAYDFPNARLEGLVGSGISAATRVERVHRYQER